jgi:aminoglycoside phosphotransferase (APT) family kinase protein
MELPDFPPITPEMLAAIAERHGLGARAFTPLPELGIFNTIYQIGDDLILRIPRDHPDFIAALYRESAVVPAARSVGVHTPALVAFDDSRDLLAVPYIVYERVDGETLELLNLEPEATPDAWRGLGRDLARLHLGVTTEMLPATLKIAHDGPKDLRPWPEALARDGYMTMLEARWLAGILERLAPAALASLPRRLLHGDTQGTNTIVRAGSLEYLAVIDWGSARWGDVAWDFAGIPLRAVPFVLEGHREIGPLDQDETAEARILWRHFEFALGNARRSPLPERSWAERPLTMLIEILRCLSASGDARWRALVF